MADAELKVDMKLNTEGVEQDIRKLQNQIRVQMAGATPSSTAQQAKGAVGTLTELLSDNPNISPSAKAKIGRLISIYEAAAIKAEKRIESIKASGEARAASLRESRNLKYMRLTESAVKNYSMLSGAIMNPTGGLTMMFAARQTFSARRSQVEQKRIEEMAKPPVLGAGGKAMPRAAMESITASAFLSGGLVAAAAGAGIALKSFTAIVEQSKRAIDFSKGMYSKSMTSGFGVKTQTYRSITSDILGVDEKEIFRFGAALAFLKPQIKTANDALSKAVVPLAEIGMKSKILEYNFIALASVIASKAAPALNLFIDGMNSFVEFAISSAGVIFKLVSSFGKGALKMVLGDIAGEALWRTVSAGVSAYDKTSSGKLGQPQSFMKQLPASTWERMGLVIGGGGGTNYGKQTADNTKDMKKSLHQIATRLGVGDRQHAATYALA